MGETVAKKKRTKTAGDAGSENPDFEGALADVEKVVERLEGGELGLTDALAEYEHGIQKIKICHETLQRAELKIQLLTQVDEDGTPHVQPIERSPPGREPQPNDPPRRGGEAGAPDMDDEPGLF